MIGHNIKKFFVLFLVVTIISTVVASVFKSSHLFEGHSSSSKKNHHNVTHVDFGYQAIITDSHSGKSDDCSCDHDCVAHRLNCCSSLTAISKTEKFLILEFESLSYSDKLFALVPTPILDGPFQPPRV